MGEGDLGVENAPLPLARTTLNLARPYESAPVILLTNEDVEPLLSMPECIAAIEAAFRDLGNEDAVDIPRQDAIVPNPRAGAIHDLKTMSGSWPASGIAAIRLNSDIVTGPTVNGVPRRVKLHLSEPGGRYNGAVLLFSTDTGQLLAMVNDGIMQRTRVGATSGVAARYLAREDAKSLGLLGTGFQAGGQLEAIASVRSLERVKVFSPTVGNRRRFVEHYRKALDLDIRAVDSAEEAVEGVDILVTATNSVSPTIKPEWLKTGMHLSSINRTELAPPVFARVDRLVLNAREGGKSFTARDSPEIGGFNQGDRNSHTGVADVSKVPELKDMVSGKAQGRGSRDEITCFHNYQGLGLQFAAIGSIVYRQAVERKIGLVLDDHYFTQTVHP
jgi:ornithine cyclodeaminase/alanine dehydrogenase-like protein (mu-crystallin family)